VVVLVGDARIHEVAAQLRSKGMKVDSVLEATGMITGTYANEPSALSRVKGVTGVEEAPIQLRPQSPILSKARGRTRVHRPVTIRRIFAADGCRL